MRILHSIAAAAVLAPLLFGRAAAAGPPEEREYLMRAGDPSFHVEGARRVIELPAEGERETYAEWNGERLTIYFRNTVYLPLRKRYAPSDSLLSGIALNQFHPHVLQMDVTVSRPSNHRIAYDPNGSKYEIVLWPKGIAKTAGGGGSVRPDDLKVDRAVLEEIDRFLEHVSAGRGRGEEYRVVLDPGHGGFDSGAIGAGGLREKDVALAVASDVKNRLDAMPGIRSFLTRRDDYYVWLSGRTVSANRRRADLFVSIHVNASENRAATGFEAYYCSEEASDAEAARVAEKENTIFDEEMEFRDASGFVSLEEILYKYEQKRHWERGKDVSRAFRRALTAPVGLEDRGTKSANFFVLRNARTPALLIECGFLSNREEEKRLGKPSYQAELAGAIAGVIREVSGR